MTLHIWRHAIFLFLLNSYLISSHPLNASQNSSLRNKRQSVRKVHLGFPDAWDGDKYQELYCPSKNIPKFIGLYIFESNKRVL
jgi:hypothetical protein